MPFIDARFTQKLDSAAKEELKSEFGRLISILGKPESYLMVGITDSADLWFGGNKLDKGAYIAVSLLGNAPSSKYSELTSALCSLCSSKLGIPGNSIYITYHPVSDWGWNGSNF